MMVMDSSKFSHTDRTQMSSPKLLSITRVWFQMNINKTKQNKKKVLGNKRQKEYAK